MPSLNPASRTVRRQPKKRLGLLRWAKRGAKVVLLLGIVGVGTMAWRSGRLQTAMDRIETTSIVLSAKSGFRVENVEVVGRSQTDPKALLAAAGLSRGAPILAFSPTEARHGCDHHRRTQADRVVAA
jgi:cell division septal protein FtsQ